MKENKKILDKVISDIVQFMSGRVNLSGQDFCHYTSPDVLEKILLRDEVCLRFTRADCLNDASEGIYIERLFSIVCKFMLEDNEISRKYYEFLTNVKTLALQNYENSIGNPALLSIIKQYYLNKTVYLCCFSYDEDSLPMWNYYVKSHRYQGYSISFVKSKLETGLINGGKNCRLVLASVAYDYQAFENLCKKLVCRYRKAYETDDNTIIAGISYCFLCFFEHYKYIVKNKSFKHENEARIIARIEEDEHYDIQYDFSKGFPIPYILVSFKKEAFHHITIGPLPEDKELTKKNTEEFLNAYGYPYNKRVKNSIIPIRY